MKKILIGMALVIVFTGYALFEHIFSPVPATTPGEAGNSSSGSSGKYKNGVYTGSIEDAYYGNVQVQATIKNRQLTQVNFLQHSGGMGHSIIINTYAMPLLSSEAIQSQTATVNIVTGATATSQAFIQSLSSALSQAK